MQLETLRDDQLLRQAKVLAHEERAVLTKILCHLREIDRRKLYCDLGYGSLFEYAVKELKYSEGQAGRRIQAMRLIKEIPEVEQSIASGELSLSNISQAQSLFRSLKKAPGHEPMTMAKKIETLGSLKNKSAREGQKELLKLQPKNIDPKTFEKERLVTPDVMEVRFLMKEGLKDKLEKVRALLGPKAIGMGYAELIEAMADLSADRLSERRFGKKRTAAQTQAVTKAGTAALTQAMTATAKTQTAVQIQEMAQIQDMTQMQASEQKPSPKAEPKPRIPKPDTTSESQKRCAPKRSKNLRYVSRSLRHEVWTRDGGRCSNCGSRHHLNIDHIRPVATGGGNIIGNLRLLCFQCNQRQAMKVFGVEHINSYSG